MELAIYDFSGNQLGYSDKIISSYREEKFNGIGSCEFHIEKSDPLAQIVTDNSHLIIEQDSIFQDIIIGWETDEDFTIHCRSLNWLLSKMVSPPISASGKVNEIAAELLKSAYGCNINMGNAPVFSDTVTFETAKAQLFSEALSACLSIKGGGHSVRFSHDDNHFYLDLLKGNELDFFVSENDGTLDSLYLYEDCLDSANSLCLCQSFSALGHWDPYSNSPVLDNNDADNLGKCYRVYTEKEEYSRFDILWKNGDYIYCNSENGKWRQSYGIPEDFYLYVPDTDVDSKYRWFCLFDGKTREEAEIELLKAQTNKKIRATAKNLEFMKDYKLGDTVRLQYSLFDTTKTVCCRFTQVTISRDSDRSIENPTLEEVI